ncbi:MAG: hypothetical protein RLP02_30360 [Coleofasciculus sp. C2-GNP5-27]
MKAYQPQPGNIDDKVMGDVRKVVRRVVNPFWFLREISRYWEDCVILSVS